MKKHKIVIPPHLESNQSAIFISGLFLAFSKDSSKIFPYLFRSSCDMETIYFLTFSKLTEDNIMICSYIVLVLWELLSPLMSVQVENPKSRRHELLN